MESQGRLSRGALFLFVQTLAVGVALITGISAQAQRLVTGAHADPPPGDLADLIEPLMASGGQRVHIGQTTLEFWWVKTLPLTEASHGVSWTALAEGTLVGAVTLSAPYPDARGQLVPTGSYTLRFVVQPQIGDRAAAAPPASVLLLSPVADDDKIDPLGRDDAVLLARQTPGASSPPAWRIDPAADGAPAPHPDDSGTTLSVTLPVSRDGMDVGALTFDVVLVGAIEP